MRVFLLLALGLNLLFSADFITQKEYAKMLYENPRGISCKKCHGAKGEGQILGYYMHKDKKKAYEIPSIQDLSFERFKEALTKEQDVKSIMPNYSLTNDEIITLYNYIKQVSKEK
ncbi:c-type cytochrome [Campylobacter helveticus]|uniref:Cytochrome c n=1 Tax=Campylobacter helveticus TaxID=28898 RepID=A0AAX2UIY7_9BACT|nr:c-type cytochrome [Campylobacter helveticus]TNB57828.1 cytochrome c [Campylobacter helveticus]TNB63894.1 cytochrome c [Campylobacter helveticus]